MTSPKTNSRKETKATEADPLAEEAKAEAKAEPEVEEAPKDEPFKEVEFWHPTRKSVQVMIPGSTRRMRFVDGYYKARSQREVDILRGIAHMYEADIPEGAPDLVVVASGWRTRNMTAFQMEANLAAANSR